MEQYREEGLIPEMKEYNINYNYRPTDHFHLIHPQPLDIYHRQDYAAAAMLAPPLIHHQDFLSNAAEPVQTHVGGEAIAAATATARWPRQETLALLEIRSSLDSNFKISNLKGPLWDQVSRIMASEHGYYRSGKKCREKFDNLYKYYKKTKDGKSGRQDGKHYRFFRQLESLYGDTHDHPPPLLETQYDQPFQFPQQNIIDNQHVQALKQPLEHDLTHNSNSSSFETSSYDDDDDDNDEYRRHGSRMGWKAKIESFIDLQMKKLMEKQEEWLERVMKVIERKEQERLLKEEEWRNNEVARIEKEHEFWAKERAWIEARDASIMDSFQKLVQRRDHAISIENYQKNAKFDQHNSWPTSRLVSLRPASREPRCELITTGNEEVVWEGNAANYMSHFGYERSGQMWDNMIGSKDRYYSKKRKENPRNGFGFSSMNEQAINQGENYSGISEQNDCPR